MKLTKEIIKNLIREELSHVINEQSPLDGPEMQKLAKAVSLAAKMATRSIINTSDESTADYEKVRDKNNPNMTTMINLKNLNPIMKTVKKYVPDATEDQVGQVIVNGMAKGIGSLGGRHVLLPADFRKSGEI